MCFCSNRVICQICLRLTEALFGHCRINPHVSLAYECTNLFLKTNFYSKLLRVLLFVGLVCLNSFPPFDAEKKTLAKFFNLSSRMSDDKQRLLSPQQQSYSQNDLFQQQHQPLPQVYGGQPYQPAPASQPVQVSVQYIGMQPQQQAPAMMMNSSTTMVHMGHEGANHLLWGCLSLFTAGLFIPCWICDCCVNGC